MDQELRALATHLGDQSSTPSTHMGIQWPLLVSTSTKNTCSAGTYRHTKYT